MREADAKISYIEKSDLTDFTLQAVTPDSGLLGWRERVRLSVVRQLFGLRHGLIGVFRLGDSILGEKRILTWLKKQGYIESFGEGTLYCDYPRLNFFGVLFRLVPSGKPLRSWGYSLPTEAASLAIKKSLWETLERQATYYTTDEGAAVSYPSFSRGDASALFPHLAKFTKEQTSSNPSLVALAEDLKAVTGFTVKSSTGAKPQFLPADCFFWGERVDLEQKKLHDYTTSGSGGGATKEGAVLSGLYELIERDAFLLLWFSGIKPRIIDLSGIDGELFTHIEEAKTRYHLEVYFFDTGYDVAVPTAVCFIIDPVLNLVALGGKAAGCGEATLKGAYLEALATLNLLRSRSDKVDEAVLGEIIKDKNWGTPKVDKSMRVNLYNSPLGIKTLRALWLTNNSNRISFADFTCTGEEFADSVLELKSLVGKQKKLVAEKGDGYHIYVHHFTSALLEHFDYHVAHVFIPALLKLHLDERLVAPLSSRVFAYAASHGKAALCEADLNPLPHPFP